MCNKPRRDCADGKAVPEKSGIASFFFCPRIRPFPTVGATARRPGARGNAPAPMA